MNWAIMQHREKGGTKNASTEDIRAKVIFSTCARNYYFVRFGKVVQSVRWLSTSEVGDPKRQNGVEFNNEAPLIVCQVTIFACGGIALGVAFSHKIFDAAISFHLLDVWSKIARGTHHHNVGFHGLAEASMLFPPRNEVAQDYLSNVENLWFTEPYNSITMRFTFDAKSIAELRAIAKGELKAMQSRIQAVLGFIWKRSMVASRMISGSFKPSVLAQAMSFPQQVGSTSSITNSIFRWGNPQWVALFGEAGSEFSNSVVFIETKCGKSIEAWMKRGCLCWKKMRSSSILQLQTLRFQAFDVIVFNF
ncbi:hypothetical protein CXB51_024535 [Gossypium anomalum]|uniref:Uncharacterized protein n=1 Tax=Gossypium anomalum TaxID=47600 RepID=A0A8J6CQ59_9ROSI|nr:hypothetical protein CXB51_024535 [Gossypium anomalum]